MVFCTLRYIREGHKAFPDMIGSVFSEENMIHPLENIPTAAFKVVFLIVSLNCVLKYSKMVSFLKGNVN